MPANTITYNQDRTASFLYRLCAFYFVINILPFPLRFLPLVNMFSQWYNAVFDILISYTGTHIFRIPYRLVSSSNGSGDTMYNYVRLFVVVILAIIATILSYVRERKDSNRNFVLWYWIMAYLRFWFGLTMIEYGVEKVIKVQFPFPYGVLTKTYGDSSPMRLLWSFMGYSTTYNVFTGMIEVVAGTLVLFKKSFLLGILLSIAVLTNVVALNFCYDVPVKLFSLGFLLTAFFLVAPYVKRLTDFFLRNKITEAGEDKTMYRTKRAKQMVFALKSILVICVLYSFVSHSRLRYVATGDGSFERTPLFGIYHVVSYVSGRDSVTQSSDVARWKTLTVLPLQQAIAETESGQTEKYRFRTDTVHKTIKIQNEEGTGSATELLYSLPDTSRLVLTGRLGNDSVSVMLQKQNLNNYELINRTFHWINEAPYK